MPSTAIRSVKVKVLTLVRAIPAGRVMTFESLAALAGVPSARVAHILLSLNIEEREMVPWHRAVAKGGAIGRGPHRDGQFAKLMREGVLVSPAGVVQDLARVAVHDPRTLPKQPEDASDPAEPKPLSRSRGMKDRPE